MEAFITNELATYGPWLLFVLLIMPLMGEEMLVIPAGFLVGQHHLPFWEIYAAAYFGSLISDAMWYFLAYRFGTPLLHRRWFKRLAHPRRLLQAKHQIERRGAWLIVTGRFVPGSRTSVMIMSGLLHMPAWKFIFAEAGSLIFVTGIQLGIGILISHGIGTTDTFGRILTIVGIVAAMLIGAFAFNLWQKHHRSTERAPRSKASWLRRFRPRVPRVPRVPAVPRIAAHKPGRSTA